MAESSAWKAFRDRDPGLFLLSPRIRFARCLNLLPVLSDTQKIIMLTFIEKHRFAVAAWILTAAALAINPYFFGISDHTYKIPFLQTAFDPSLYPRDITVAMRRFYVSFFYLPAGPLIKVFGLKNAFFLLHLLSCALFFTMIYRIAQKISGIRFLGVLAIMLLFFPKDGGGGVLTIDFVTQERFAASSILLFCVYLLISARPVPAGILFGLAANIHLISAVNFSLFILFFFLSCAVRPFDSKRQFVREFLSFLFFAVLSGLPIVLKKITSDGGNLTAFVDPEWMRMVLLRSPYHFEPDYSFFFGHFVFGAVSLSILAREDVLKKRPIFFYTAASALAAMTAGFVFASIFLGVFPLLTGLCLSFYRAGYFYVLLAAMTCGFIMLKVFPKNVWLAWTAAALISLLNIWVQLIPLGAAAVYLYFKKEKINPFPSEPSLKQLFILVFVFILSAGIWKCFQPRPIAPDPSLKAAQIWVNQNTDQDALILMPPYEEDFRVFSARSTAGSWKDWTYNVLDRKFAFEMQDRLRDFCGISADVCKEKWQCLNLCYKNYAALGESKIAEITRKYGIDFIVRNRKNPLNLELVYQNQKYLIYKAPHAYR